MRIFLSLLARNIKLYLRDRSTVFFSLLSSLIIIGLFVLFLGKMYTNGAVANFAQFGINAEEEIRALIISWVLAGIIVLNSISVPQMMLSRIVLDREANVLNDLYVTPFNRSHLALSYIVSSIIVGTIITFITFLIGEVYIYSLVGRFFSLGLNLTVLGITALCTLSFASLMFLFNILIKNSSAIGGVSAFVSSVGGFLAGIYVSVGDLSGAIKDIISGNPLAHATALIRNVIMNDQIDSVFEGVPSFAVDGFRDGMGLNLYVGDFQFSNMMFVVSLLTLTIICFALSYFKLSSDKM